MTLARRSLHSVSWNMFAGMVGTVILLSRSIVLARLLPVEVFGIYAGARAAVSLVLVNATFGMEGAFIHRVPETADEDQAAAVQFTLKLLFTVVLAALLLSGAFLLISAGPTRTAVVWLTVAGAGMHLAQTPQLILKRRVKHQRLATIKLAQDIFGSLLAIALAYQGSILWALLSVDLVSLALNMVGLYIWRPVWRPRLAWTPPIVRYFLVYGSRLFLASFLSVALDRVDDLWARVVLGPTATGFYSRAYAFALYPRKILAAPINLVAGGTYAELKYDRLRLSQAFYRTNAFLVRSGFFLAGLLALVAPELIRLTIGDKWLPMANVFRLMLVFTLLDPIKITIASLFTAVGRPEYIVRARTVQLIVLILGLLVLGRVAGIIGVALAVNLMLVVGIIVLLYHARPYADFSIRGLFAVPALALGAGLAFGSLTMLNPTLASSDWLATFAKMTIFGFVYLLLELLFEGRTLYGMTRSILAAALGARE